MRNRTPNSRPLQRDGRPRALAATALAAAAITMVGACSSSDGAADKIATVDGTASPDDADDGTLEYRKCMAAEGIDLPEPGPQGGNAVGSTTEVPAIDADPDEIAAADAKCSGELPDAPNPLEGLTPDQQAAFKDYNLKVQRCVDDKGFEGMSVLGEDVPGATEPPDFDWDAFDQAASDCYDSIPLPEELAGIEAEG